MKEDKIINPRYPHTIKIVRVNKSPDVDYDDPLEEPLEDGVEAEEILYEGKGRSFTDTTTTGTDKVDLNKRKASIPVRYDEWGAAKKPLDGDTIYAAIGENTEVGMVRDCESDNNRTLVYWDYVRV